jgi:hypothetical protein
VPFPPFITRVWKTPPEEKIHHPNTNFPNALLKMCTQKPSHNIYGTFHFLLNI